MKVRFIFLVTIFLAFIPLVAITSFAGDQEPDEINKQASISAQLDTINGVTTRISIADGLEGNAGSAQPSISGDGRFVAFYSDATNLVTDDTNGVSDVFVFDHDTNEITRVSVSSDGTEGNGRSSSPSISADGRFIAFVSAADNLENGDNNGIDDVFVHDRITGDTSGVSMEPGSEALSGGSTPAISADGHVVAYLKFAETTRHFIYVHDFTSSEPTTILNIGAAAFSSLAISYNGDFLAFDSRDDDLVAIDNNFEDDVFIYNRNTSQIELISVSTSEIQGNQPSRYVSISADGRYVAFASLSSNLGSGETAQTTDWDVFVRDRQEGTTQHISNGYNGDVDGSSRYPVISRNGQFVTFTSWASNLVDDDTNGVSDIFMHELPTGQLTRISIDSNGTQSDNSSGFSDVSDDGRYIAFSSTATNLDMLNQDTNNVNDIFVHDRLIRTGNYSITGQVRDSNDSPLSSATIATTSGLVTNSDDNGTFSFTGLVTDTYTLTASLPGYNFLHSWTVAVPPNHTEIDFIGFIEDYAIMGQTRSENNFPLSSVTIASNTGLTTTSDLHGNYIFTGLVTGTYSLTATLPGYKFLHSWTVTVPPNHTGIDFIGYFDDMIDIGFRPNFNGYSFVNPTGTFPIDPTPYNPDYSNNEMIKMFGEQAVCWKVIGPVCVIRPAAERWLWKINRYMNAGHCDGIAVTSLRFFKELDNPEDFQSSTDSPYHLEWGSIRHHIAYYFAEQTTDPVRSYKNQIVRSAPSEIVMMLQQAMVGDTPDPTTLIVRFAGSGHAITPYAIEDRGDGLYWIWVYDNNHPNDKNRYVIVDTITETWSYNLGWTTWSGNADTHTLGIVPISLYAQQPMCPSWCENETETLNSSPSVGEIQYQGDGHLLITNASNQRIGYDGSQFVNEIPNAHSFEIDTGTGISLEPIYSIPLDEDYAILFDGQTLTQTTTMGAFTQFGPGYATFVDDIVIAPSSPAFLSITPNGKQASFQAELDNEIQLGFAWDTTEIGYQLTAQSLEISAGHPITLTVDENNNQLVYQNKQAGNSAYDFSISRLTTTGEQVFFGTDIGIEGESTHYIQYGDWGNTGSLTIEVDHNSDGTIDEIIQVDNKLLSTWIYLPLILR